MKNFRRTVAVAVLAICGLASVQSVEAQVPGPDAEALKQLAASGSDLSKLHRVEFFLRFATEETAVHAASQLEELAFAAATEHDVADDSWVVVASKRMYPVESDLQGLRDKLNLIAAEGRGKYTGWRAKAVR